MGEKNRSIFRTILGENFVRLMSIGATGPDSERYQERLSVKGI